MTPDFIPFAAMTDGEQREHLRRVHSCPSTSEHNAAALRGCHAERMADPEIAGTTPHTHDKPAPRRTEENT